jgi:hypothetical protein
VEYAGLDDFPVELRNALSVRMAVPVLCRVTFCEVPVVPQATEPKLRPPVVGVMVSPGVPASALPPLELPLLEPLLDPLLPAPPLLEPLLEPLVDPLLDPLPDPLLEPLLEPLPPPLPPGPASLI